MDSSFDIIVIIGGLCGLVMVIGSIYLLSTGAIKLTHAPSDNAVALELVNQVKLTTRYPAIGLFIIGLIFVLGSAYLAKPEPKISELPIKGTLSATDLSGIGDVQVEFFVPGPIVHPNQSGDIERTFFHKSPPSELSARIIAPGYQSSLQFIPLKEEGNVWTIEYSLGEKVAEQPPRRDRNIADADDANLAPLDRAPEW